jgi:hypothetical protein
MGDTNTLLEEVKELASAIEEDKAKLGTGSRFKSLVKNIKKGARHVGRKKIYDPKAVAAAIGRKKYGKAKFQKMAAAGHRKG